ncbi:hypothetical protein ANCCAN_23344 [Ancylostoma caninum]|uniref:Uncharacterized protein n=1 Tax=Ancylostoma caninum TaxID=29170 RepID=A0A368FFF3_ANCCA|nr:hypothetical protein ANCCAN_23344 [Ancylostoma caninum]
MRPHPQPRSGVRRSQLWRGDDSITQSVGHIAAHPESRTRANSLKTFHAAPSIERTPQRRHISNEEQHKLELLQQIEENKRRRELEKQKEREEEEREIRRQIIQVLGVVQSGKAVLFRLERYNEKIRQEEEEERRKQREKAEMMERRSEEVRASNERRARRNSSPRKGGEGILLLHMELCPHRTLPAFYTRETKLAHYKDSPEDCMLLFKGPGKFRTNIDTINCKKSITVFNELLFRARFFSERKNSVSPSEEPRLEWWQKKPTWQQKVGCHR